MPATHPLAPRVTPPRPPIVRRLTVLTLVFACLALLSGCTPEQQQAFAQINQSRRSAGLHQLAWHGHLGEKAQAWAEHMARQGRISHSTLAHGVPPGWDRLGENVGVGGSIDQVHGAYLNSAGHRANIMNPAWSHVGTGVARGNGRVYTVHVFMRQ